MGSDDAIKVEYNPVKLHNDVQGFLQKVRSQAIEHLTIIKNTKPIEVNIKVLDQLPKSNDEKIKVKLIDPDMNVSVFCFFFFFFFFFFLHDLR
jgi:hypothetical protein